MAEDTLEKLKGEMAEFVKKRDWAKYHDPKNLAMSISIEAAELMELFQWLTNDEAALKIKEKEFKELVEGEIADVLIYSLSLANFANIDLAQAIRKKMLLNNQRFPEIQQ